MGTIYHTVYTFNISSNQLIAYNDIVQLKDLTTIDVADKVVKIFYE